MTTWQPKPQHLITGIDLGMNQATVKAKWKRTSKVSFDDDKFEQYMQGASYSPVTKHLYRCRYRQLARRLLEADVPFRLNQTLVDQYMIMIKHTRNPGALGFIKAYMRCYDPDNELRLKIQKPLGRRAIEEDKVRHTFLEQENINELIAHITDPQLKIMVRIYAETGLRATELQDWSAHDKRYTIDWEKRVISGIGKYGKPYHQPFSTKTAAKLKKWILHLKNNLKRDHKRPFVFYKKNGELYLNQHGALWKRLNKTCKDNKLQHIHPHMFRHFVGHNLRVNHKFDLEQIRRYLRHKKLETTKIYAGATDEELYAKMNQEVFK